MILPYNQFVQFIAAGSTSKDIVDFDPSEETKARVADLIHREKTAALTGDETAELNRFLHIEHVMRLAKARARQRLGNN